MPSNRPTPLIKVISLATLLIGTLDISDALIFYSLRGVPTIRIRKGSPAAFSAAPRLAWAFIPRWLAWRCITSSR
jgi:hypothetical protein